MKIILFLLSGILSAAETVVTPDGTVLRHTGGRRGVQVSILIEPSAEHLAMLAADRAAAPKRYRAVRRTCDAIVATACREEILTGENWTEAQRASLASRGYTVEEVQ